MFVVVGQGWHECGGGSRLAWVWWWVKAAMNVVVGQSVGDWPVHWLALFAWSTAYLPESMNFFTCGGCSSPSKQILDYRGCSSPSKQILDYRATLLIYFDIFYKRLLDFECVSLTHLN